MPDLHTIINKEIELFTDMISLETDKREILIKGDANALDAIVKKEQTFIMKSAVLEQQRESYLKSEGITMQDVINSDEEKGRCGELAELLKKVQKLSMINQKLVKSRIDVINFITERMGYQAANSVSLRA
jgi:flagellar biosynthesis/type III secretory pathway chaperone